MKYITLIIIGLFVSTAIKSQTTQWDFDFAHSKITFTVTHMMVTDVVGQFNKYEGSVFSDKDDFSDVKINFTIDPSSINTDNAKRDKHLRSADFFDVEKFPAITFESSKMKKTAKGKYKLSGMFTMIGVTKPITLNIDFKGIIKDPWGGTRAGFKISANIDRTAWGLKYNSVIPTGGVVIGNEVKIICNVELIKK